MNPSWRQGQVSAAPWHCHSVLDSVQLWIPPNFVPLEPKQHDRGIKWCRNEETSKKTDCVPVKDVLSVDFHRIKMVTTQYWKSNQVYFLCRNCCPAGGHTKTQSFCMDANKATNFCLKEHCCLICLFPKKAQHKHTRKNKQKQSENEQTHCECD